jgi:hypothetical protein
MSSRYSVVCDAAIRALTVALGRTLISRLISATTDAPVTVVEEGQGRSSH